MSTRKRQVVFNAYAGLVAFMPSQETELSHRWRGRAWQTRGDCFIRLNAVITAVGGWFQRCRWKNILPRPRRGDDGVRKLVEMASRAAATQDSKVRDREAAITSTRGAWAPPNYAGAPPRAPGSGGATSGATTCLGGFSGAGFLLGVPPMPGGGLIKRPCSMISLIWEPSRVSNSSSAFAMVSRVLRLLI